MKLKTKHVSAQPNEPLRNTQHEAFVQALFGAGPKHNVTDAYAACHPKVKRTTARANGDRLLTNADIRARLTWLQTAAASSLILTREMYLKALERRFLGGMEGFRSIMTILPDGAKTIEITPENADLVQKGTSRVETSGRGDGKQDACFVSAEMVDPLPYGKEIATLLDWYPPKKTALAVGDGKGGPVKHVIEVQYGRKGSTTSTN